MICMFKAIYYCQMTYFRYMYLEIYELDPAKFLSAPGLAWQAIKKKKKGKIRSFN